MPLCPPHDWIQVQPIMWLTLVSKNISVGSLQVFVGFTQSLSCWLTGTDDHILKRQTWFDDSPFQLFNFYIRKVDHIERWTDRLENTKEILADICANAMCTQYAHMWDNQPRWLRPGNQSGLETYSLLYLSQWIMPRDELTCRYAWKTLSPDGRLAINADWTSCAGNHCNPPKGNQLDEDTHWTHTGWTLDTHWTHTGPRCLDHPELGLDRPFLEARRLKSIESNFMLTIWKFKELPVWLKLLMLETDTRIRKWKVLNVHHWPSWIALMRPPNLLRFSERTAAAVWQTLTGVGIGNHLCWIDAEVAK